MDDLGPIEIEFIINNPELLTAAGRAEATLQGVTDAVQQSAIQSSSAITAQVNAMANSQFVMIERLKTELTEYQVRASVAPNIESLAIYNQKIEELTAEIVRMNNVGKTGFDDFGVAVAKVAPAVQTISPALDEVTPKMGKFQAAIERVTNVQNIGARVVTQFSRQLISLGVGVVSGIIGAKAIEALADYISNLDIFKGKITEAILKQQDFNKAFESADYSKAIEGLDSLKINLQLAKEGFGDQDSVINQYNETIGKVAGNVDTLNQAEQGIIKNGSAFIKIILQKAVAQIALAEAVKATYQADQIANTPPTPFGGKNNNGSFGGNAPDAVKQYYASLNAEQKKGQDQLIANQHKAADQQIKIATDALKAVDDIQKKNGYGAGNGGNDAIATLQNQLLNDQLERKKIQSQTIINDDKQSYQARLAAINDFYNASKGIATNNEKLALSNKQLSADQKLHIENEYGNQVLALSKSRNEQLKSLDKDNSADAILSSQTSLQQKIQALKDSYQAKDKTRDEQELDAVGAKYTAIYNEIVAQNVKYSNYIKTHSVAQATAKGLTLIDPNSVKPDEQKAIDDVTEKQQSDADFQYYKADLDKQKKLFDDYEAYKLKVGTQKANEQYAADLNGNQSYIDYLQKELSSDRIDPNDTTQGTAQRKALLQAQLADALAAQKQQYTKLLESVQTYETQRNNLTAVYQDKRTELVAAGNMAEVAVLDEQYKQQLGALDDANFEKLQSVKLLYDGIANMSAANAKKLITDVQTELNARIAAGTITLAEAKKTQNEIDKLQNSLDMREPEGLKAAAEDIDRLGQSLTGVNKGFGDTLVLIAQEVKGIGEMETAYNAYVKAVKAADLEAEITSIIGIILVAIELIVKAITAIFTLFSSAHKSAVQAAADMQAYQDSLISGQIKYNELLRDQERTQTDISKLSLAQLETQQQALALQTQGAQADYNTLLQQIQAGGQQITGEHTEKYGGFLGIAKKTKVVQDLAGLSDADYDTLEKLYTEGKLTSTTATWFEQLQTVKNEMDAIGTSAQDVLDAINQAATGTTADAIASAIIQGFQSGKRTAADFAGDFSTMMQNALLSAFQSNVLNGQIATFYQQFADASNSAGGLTPAKIAILQQAYAQIIANTSTEVAQIQKITGASVTTGTGGGNTLTGAIQGITAQQADLLAGQFGGLRLTQLETNQILTGGMAASMAEMKRQTLTQMQIAADMKRTADNTDTMTADLKTVAKNTSSTNLTNALRAAGV